MLLAQFILQNGHFALNLFASLVFFAVSWLYLDAFLSTKSKKELFKILGFSLLSVSFLIHATHIEQSAISNLILANNFIEIVSDVVRFVAYILIILGLIFDPIQKNPSTLLKIQTQKRYLQWPFLPKAYRFCFGIFLFQFFL